jgi:hypothetical protein
MTANLSLEDRPFSEYSPFYNPPPPTDSQTSSTMQRPNIAPTTSQGEQLRHDSIASTVSSFEPGDDLSSFDASFSRAMPGFRGEPVVGMHGWQESLQEESAAKTWEEDLERRARAGAELQRRAEEAARREQEERLQQEFWEQEREGWGQQAELTAPSRPPKEMAIGIGAPAPPSLAPSNPWSDKAGDAQLPAQAATQAQVSTQAPAATEAQVPAPAEAPRAVTPVSAAHEESQLTVAPPQPPRRSPPIDPATEIYTIKHVNIISPVTGTLHRVPILLQNANGPCPLMALVNAIIISTPPSSRSPLSEVLRLREQVSLSLLLQAVFEELMTRTPQDGQSLPDVGDLFAFLVTLHTGMNVNPCFNAPPATPGAFEPTKELELYAAFSVPLVHGWLPVPNTPSHAALERAKTYDSAQLLLFAEDELITRLTTSPTHIDPSPSEQQILQDTPLVREFIESTATQLTTHGLETLRRYLPEMKPCILFRNDHFSTILRRPHGELVALVTDMGFAGHQEVVWERIADVNGRETVFLSGDFRPVGGSQHGDFRPAGGPQQQQQVQHPPLPPRQPQSQPQRSMLNPDAPPPEPDEDYDLALAIQLQEEENAHAHRQQQQQQQHQQQHLQQPPMLPPRSGTTPPPPYDLPPGQAHRTQEGRGADRPSVDTGNRGAWMESQQRMAGRRGSGVHRLPPGAVAGGPGPGGKKDEEKCVIM